MRCSEDAWFPAALRATLIDVAVASSDESGCALSPPPRVTCHSGRPRRGASCETFTVSGNSDGSDGRIAPSPYVATPSRDEVGGLGLRRRHHDWPTAGFQETAFHVKQGRVEPRVCGTQWSLSPDDAERATTSGGASHRHHRGGQPAPAKRCVSRETRTVTRTTGQCALKGRTRRQCFPITTTELRAQPRHPRA